MSGHSPHHHPVFICFLRQHGWWPPRMDRGWLGGHPGTLALGHWLSPQLCLPSIYQERQPVPEWAGTWSPESWVGHKGIEGSKGKQAFTYHLHKRVLEKLLLCWAAQIQDVRGNCPNAQPLRWLSHMSARAQTKQENTHEKVTSSRAGILVILVCFVHCCLPSVYNSAWHRMGIDE